MAIELMKHNHPILRQKMTPVPDMEKCKPIIDKILSALRSHGGLGLAANQINEYYRIFVIKYPGSNFIFVNPEIVRLYGGTFTTPEMSLSFPGQKINKIRNRQVEIRGFDEDWNPISRKLKGKNAVIAQHLMDTLDGIIWKDYENE